MKRGGNTGESITHLSGSSISWLTGIVWMNHLSGRISTWKSYKSDAGLEAGTGRWFTDYNTGAQIAH